jgi:hypothetical protein
VFFQAINDGGKQQGGIPLESEGGETVVGGRALVKKDVGNAAPGGRKRNGSRRLDLEGGPDGKDEIGRLGGGQGAPKGFGGHLLSEHDGRGLEEAPACAARRATRSAKRIKNGGGIGVPAAVQTGHPPVGAVQFHDTIRTVAGRFVQTVDILRDERFQAAEALQLHQGPMGGVGPRVPERRVAFQLVVPVFDARFLGRNELLIVHRAATGPDALRPAEIRYAGRRGNPRAREDKDMARVGQQPRAPLGEGVVHGGVRRSFTNVIVTAELFRKTDGVFE